MKCVTSANIIENAALKTSEFKDAKSANRQSVLLPNIN
jgi:hypothetical protein